jgi:hypothetical protein
VLVACLALAGCGGNAASSRERSAVRELVPGAREIRCERSGALTRCHADTGNALVGATWTCEFRVYADPVGAAYSADRSCWTDDGPVRP